MSIRAAEARDLGRIVELFEQLGYPASIANVERQTRVLREHGMGQVFVADQDGAVAGVAVVHLLMPVHVEQSWALLSALIVDEARRSAGIGAQLLAAAEAFACSHGCSQLELSSNTTRLRAHAFYERQGYREKRRRFIKSLA